MTAFAISLFVVSVLLLLYALKGRAWLKSKPWAAPFFAWIEPYEIFLFKKSETILFGRLLTGLGAVLTFLTQFGEIDLTPFMPFVPEKYQPFVNVVGNCLPLLISVVGWLVEKLRSTVSKPLELVALPDKVVADNPILAEATAAAPAIKAEAVAVAADAKAA